MVSDSSNKSVNMVKKTVKDVKKDMKDNKSDNKTDNKQNTKENTKILKKNTVSDFELSLMNRSLSENKKKEDANNLDVNDIFRVLDLHFYKDFYTYRHLHNSYNKFIDETIPDFLKNSEHVFTESVTEQRIIKHKFEFTNIRADTPKMSNDVDPLFPSDARKLMLSYQMSIYADVTQYREIVDINSTGKSKIKKEKIGHTEENMVVMTVPTMLRSKYCNLNVHAEDAIDECRYDPGGYFIINGSEKIVISQDKMIPNTPLVFMKKGSNASYHVVQVNSTSDDLSNMMQTVSIRLKKDGVMVMKFPILYEVNPMIVFRALGIETDADIAEICVYDKTDYHMLDLVRTSLDNCFNDNREGSRIKIRTREEAIDYLITKMKVVRKYTETSQSVKHEQKRLHLLQLLKSSLLPHITGTSEHPYKEKALYMGYMINKLLKVELGREEVHNRDSYNNKRVANINELLGEIMVQHYKSNISECNKKFMDWMKDKIATEEPHNVIHHFKASVFEQGFKTALMLGNWPRAKGVSQMLSRISYMQFISFLSRIDSQSTSKSSSKLTKPRQTDPSSVPFLCCVTGDTEILQKDNASITQIKDMMNGGSIRTVYKDDLREISTPITNYFSRMANDIIKIDTITGRSIKCTKDHPILVLKNDKYIMIEAGKLDIGDKIITRHMEKYVKIDKDMNVVIKKEMIKNNDYIDELATLGYIDKKIPLDKLETLARLIGASVTDGHIEKVKSHGSIKKEQYSAQFSVGEEEDAYEVYNDIQSLGFGSSSISRQQTKHINKKNGIHTIHNTWKISQTGAFGYLLVTLGAFVGKKTANKKSIPEWILNGNNRVKREFLSGFNGGDGSRMSIQSNVKDYKLHIGGTGQTTIKSCLDDCVEYMTQIKKMYSEFGVNGKIVTRDVKDEPDKKCVFFYPDCSYDNIEKISDYIGYRYCNDKRRASAPVIEYVKYKNVIANEKIENYKRIIEMYTSGSKPKEICAKTGIKYQQVKRIIENHNKGFTPKGRQYDINSIKYEEFKKQYYLRNLNHAIPIKSITKMPDELVYDFTTVLDSHTFIANGFVVSNCVQTPEHAKIGMIKHLSLIGSITIGDKDNTAIVREYIMKHPDVKRITDVPIHELKNMFKVMLNGEWIGMIKNEYEVDQDFTDNPVLRLYSNAKAKKIKGEFDPQMTSVVLDTNGAEVRFNTDSGRLYRPVLRVVGDNELVLTKAMIDRISLKSDNPGKISSWDDFYTIEEAPIEFLDSEEQPFAMVAPMIKDLNREREKILGSKNFKLGKEREDTIINRYSDKFFVRYDYCEIHPSVLLGEIATNIPFTNRNAGPRNIFQYAQGRQGMGIYCTTYRSRTDISYILYYPETPIVNSRTSKYTYTDVLGPGSNAIVAITTYGGHNQEDSLIFNKTSLERGIFRSMSLKKYVSQVTKNQETSANDKFMKPTPDKTLSMKNGNYEKLNLEGYLPEETKITNNDIIFGKVTPITDMPDSDKIYKDESEQFKEKSDGVIDRMYIGINNQEGHEVRKALVRMERMPMVGDKFCYTEDHEVLTTTGWVSIKDITKEHYVATLVNGTTLKYQKPKAVQVLDHDGDMYVVDSNQVSLKVTPNHRMYVADRSGKKFKIELAQDIKGKRRKYLKNVEKVDVSNLQKPRELKFDSNGNVTKFLVYGSKKDVDKSKDVFNQMVVKDIKSFVGKYKEDIETSLKIVQDEIKAFNLEVETYRKKHGDIDNDFTARMKIRKEILDIKLKWYTDSDIEFPKLKEVKNTKIKVVKKKHIEIKENNKVLPMKISLSNSGVELIANTNTNANTNVDKGVDIKPIKIAKGVTKQVKADQKSEDLDEDMAKDEECVLHEFDINAWLEFFGIWLAEGSIAGNGKCVAFAANKQRVKDRLTPLCETMRLKIGKYKFSKDAKLADNYTIYAPYITKILNGFGTAIYKYLPEWVWFLNKEQARILINGMMLGDGHQMKGTTTRRYDTSSTRLRDDFQRLCLHAGYAANYALKYEAGHKSVVKTRNGKALTKKETITSTVDAFRLAVIETQTMPIVNKNIKADGTGGNDRYEKFKGKVYCCTVPNDGVIYVRRNGLGVWSGNCSRHGQKGTVGIGLKASDMPHTKNGIRPDIIMNPNAIPSRMTIGQFWEQLLGKVGALMGINVDSTSFEDYDINEVREMLRKLGYNDVGEEYLYNGMTGMRMKTSIFIAPAFYQRLKHMVYDKMHARARGSTTILVRQAAEGRTREGGLRLGEMERDALIAHGMSKFLNEKMMYTADVYSTYVCGICGLFAIREVTRNSENKPMPGDIYKCPTCKNYHDIHKIMIPYAFKLMIQELMAMNILARIRVKKSERKIIREIGEIE